MDHARSERYRHFSAKRPQKRGLVRRRQSGRPFSAGEARRKLAGDSTAPAPIDVRTILECATVNGAACAGLAGTCGVLTSGAEADVVMIRTDDIILYPSNNAVGTVVLAADIRNIDTVIIGGQVRKSRGRLVGVDMVKLRRLVDESREYLFTKAGYEADIFASRNGIRD